ncbi:MAG: HAD family hydrolase, partial [Chloroflexi bacterium]|nr:HAD family hydrolase [Chloroflexota bacterium]
MIKNLIWDVDGTLFDTYPAIVRSFQQALEGLGHTAGAAEVKDLALVSIQHCARQLAGHYGVDAVALEERFDDIYSAIPKAEQRPYPGVGQVLAEVLARGGVNAIVTHRRRASTEELLGVHELRDLFSDIAAGDEGYPKKPAPDAFHVILARCQMDPAHTATVGDRENDIRAGQAAGLVTCWFHGRQVS